MKDRRRVVLCYPKDNVATETARLGKLPKQIAQWVEHNSDKVVVSGSNPDLFAINMSNIKNAKTVSVCR